jgi:hypothetical protein
MGEQTLENLAARVETVAQGLGLSHLTNRYALACLVAHLSVTSYYNAEGYVALLREKGAELANGEGLLDLADIIEKLIGVLNGRDQVPR